MEDSRGVANCEQSCDELGVDAEGVTVTVEGVFGVDAGDEIQSDAELDVDGEDVNAR